jgi:hypothetical protein
MIIQEKAKDVQVGGNFQTNAFTIQASAKAFEILSSNIYTHKVRAVIREISCNAFDAHALVKNPNPFDVHLPTYLESWFSVRDYGPGLSPDQIVKVYTTYFFSTKDGSNEYIGGLGIGAKSFFCLADSCTVISFFEGTKYTYSCYKNENNEPQIALITQEETTEPNGLLVSVTVPASNRVEFEMEAANVYQYFDKQPNINTDSVKNVIAEKQKYLIKTDEYCLTGKYGTLHAVMGNVAYVVDYSLNPHNLEGFVRFDIGELNFDPGREKLSLDDKTKKAVAAKTTKLGASIVQMLLKQIEAEPTDFKKTLKYSELNNSHLGFAIKNNHKLFTSFVLHNTKTDFKHFSYDYGRAVYSLRNRLPLHNTKYYLDKDGYTNRVKAYVKDHKIDICLLSQEHINELKIDKELILDLALLPKLARNPSNKAPTEGISLFTGSYRRSITELPVGEKVYVEMCRDDAVGYKYAAFSNIFKIGNSIKLLTHIKMPDIYMVKTAVTKKKTFTNDNWIRLDDYIDREYAKVKKVGFIKYEGRYENFFNLLCGYKNVVWPADHPVVTFSEKSQLKKKAESCPVLSEIGYYDKSMIDDTMEKLEAEMFAEFPMLRAVDPSDYYKFNNHMRPEKETWEVVIDYLLTRKEEPATI